MAVLHVYLIPGTMTRVQGGWCDACQVSSVWTGPVWRLAPAGVSLHGHVTGCAQCRSWTTRTVDPSEPAPARRLDDVSRDARPAGPG